MNNPFDTINISLFELRQLLVYAVERGIDYASQKGKNISLAEAAKKSGLSKHIIREAISKGELKAIKTGHTKNCKLLINSVEFQVWHDTRSKKI